MPYYKDLREYDTLQSVGVNVVRQIFDETKRNRRYAGLFDAQAAINLHDRTVRAIVALSRITWTNREMHTHD